MLTTMTTSDNNLKNESDVYLLGGQKHDHKINVSVALCLYLSPTGQVNKDLQSFLLPFNHVPLAINY